MIEWILFRYCYLSPGHLLSRIVKCSTTISHALLIISANGVKLRQNKKCVKLLRARCSLLHEEKQRRDREVLFYSDLRGLLANPRTFTLRDRILRIRAAALFLPVFYAVIDPTYAVEAIPGEYSARRNLWMYLEDVTVVSPRPPPPFSRATIWTLSYRALLSATRLADRVDGAFRIRRRFFAVRRQFDIVIKECSCWP